MKTNLDREISLFKS